MVDLAGQGRSPGREPVGMRQKQIDAANHNHQQGEPERGRHYFRRWPFLTILTNSWWTRVSSDNSGWNVAAMIFPWRTNTGSPPALANTSTPLPVLTILGARMNTISSGLSPS